MSENTLNPDSIAKNTRCSSKQEFTDRLRRWQDHTNEIKIGGSIGYGGTPWLWVQVGGYKCHLNADTNREGVARYLELVNLYGPDMPWPVRSNQGGNTINKVCFGQDSERIAGFFLYVKPALFGEEVIGGEPSTIVSKVLNQGQPGVRLPHRESGAAMEFQGARPTTFQRDTAPKQTKAIWRELDSLRFIDNAWSMTATTPSPEIESALFSIPMIDAGPCRHAAAIEIGGDAGFCHIAIRQRRDPIGCRVLAAAFEKIICHYGGINTVPEKVYIRASDGSEFRRGKLIMLGAYADPATRRDIWNKFSYVHVPEKPGESPLDYQVRAVNVVRERYEGCELEDPSRLNFARMQSQPDGLFKRAKKNELIIVEAKQRRPDFEEGTAQIVQYFAQAKYCGRYADSQIHLCLVTSESNPTGGYRHWQEWMQSPKRLKIFVAD